MLVVFSFTSTCKFNLYIKPTFTFSYVLPESNHPSFVFKNIPKGVFFRIRRICSDLSDYLFHAYTFSLQFFKKNYNRDHVLKCLRMVSELDREQILPYKMKSNSFDYFENIFFKLPFMFQLFKRRQIFSKL
jgi:hypothetical protein